MDLCGCESEDHGGETKKIDSIRDPPRRSLGSALVHLHLILWNQMLFQLSHLQRKLLEKKSKKKNAHPVFLLYFYYIQNIKFI